MKILHIDRDAELVSLTAALLRHAGYDSCQAADRPTALQLFELASPDLILLEHHAVQFDGIQFCRELRRRSKTPIIVLSAHDREEDLVAAFEAGADDFLRKPFSPRVLLARVRARLRRVEKPADELLTVAHMQLASDEWTLQIGTSPPIPLTPHEFAVVRRLMSTPGRTVTSEALIMHVWGEASRSKQRMLKQLIYRLRRKLEVDPASPRLIVTTPQAGYRLIVEAHAGASAASM